ncbi:MAG: polysaccharide deacetylase family protein [Bacteroidales bacterium]|nr:polysaccharide deacetylase family protein [Bacteroidales bacterium]
MRRIILPLMSILLVSCAASPSQYVALSFDDGPDSKITSEILDILKEHNVPASFFVIGQNINDSTAVLMNRAVDMGCEIQNHSYTHSFMTQLPIEDFVEEIRRTDDLVEKYTGIRPTLFRPPYIDHNPSMHAAVGHTFICGVGCQDWEAERSAQMRFDDIMAQVKDGDIILLHDFEGNVNTVEALKLMIPELKNRGYSLVTVSELFRRKGVSPEANSGYIYTNVLGY